MKDSSKTLSQNAIRLQRSHHGSFSNVVKLNCLMCFEWLSFGILDLQWCRLSHKLPINSQKVADKSVRKLLKSCYFIFKVAKNLPNSCCSFSTWLHLKLVLLRFLPAEFVWIFLSLISVILAFSVVARFVPSLLASSIGLIRPSSARSSQLESESLTV